MMRNTNTKTNTNTNTTTNTNTKKIQIWTQIEIEHKVWTFDLNATTMRTFCTLLQLIKQKFLTDP